MAKKNSDRGLGEIGGELNLEEVTRIATTVKRKPLELGLDSHMPKRSRGAGASVGGESLDGDAFLSRKEKEAMARAAGATPTLDRLGKGAPSASQKRPQGPERPPQVVMDRELTLRQQGMPTWGWFLLAGLTFALGFVALFTYLKVSRERDIAAAAAELSSSTERLESQERERRNALSPGAKDDDHATTP